VLAVHGVEACVFEREAFSRARTQGGSLDMHWESGQYAIGCAGLTEEFAKIARYEDQEVRVYDKRGVLRFKDEDVTEKDRPEVDRGHLRQMLLDSLGEGVVRWGFTLNEVVQDADGTVELGFTNGVRERFDLVVGADGAWSKVRPLVSEARPVYSGVMFVALGIEDADRREPEAAKRVGRGMMFAIGDEKTIMGHRDADAHLGIYAAMRVPEDWVAMGGFDWRSAEAVKASLRGYFADWDESLVRLIERSDGDRVAPRAIYALPVGHRWENRAGVTLLGDAAHLMSPFGGDGANLAMWDGADLGLRLAGGGDWREAVRGFEVGMFARAEGPARGAWDAIQEVFSEGGLEHMVEVMGAHRG
jgi:2-polyprenyl-6-methoxyphenol hydroxylase-like FAD-dependent oxidoreductase